MFTLYIRKHWDSQFVLEQLRDTKLENDYNTLLTVQIMKYHFISF